MDGIYQGRVGSDKALHALSGGVRQDPAPDLAGGSQQPVSLARDGSLRINADLYDHLPQVHLVADGSFTRSVPTYPFDGLWTNVDGAVVYYQPRGRPYHVEDGLTFADPTKWSGTGWSVSGNKATHTPGYTDPLVATLSSSRPLVTGERYAVVLSITGRTAGQVNARLGSTLGTARSSNGTFVEVLAVSGSPSAAVVPDSSFDGSVSLFQAYPRSPELPARLYAPLAGIEVVGQASPGAKGTLVAWSDSAEVHVCYRRVPGAPDLG